MSFNYTASAATARRLLKRFGQEVALISIEPGTYDTATGAVVPSMQEQAGYGVLLNLSIQEAGAIRQEGSQVEGNLQKLLLQSVAADGFLYPPRPSDRVRIGTDEHTVSKVKTLSPAGTDVLYELLVHR
jgi:hypothetical protein